MKYIIDRFEGEFAVCENQENQEMVNILIELLPEDVHEGSVLIEENGVYQLDIEYEEERQQTIQEKMNMLWKK